MKNSKHQLFGKIGAFWIEGNDSPFFGISEIRDYQYKHGGNILDLNGKMLYKDLESNCPTCSSCQCRVHHDTSVSGFSTCEFCGSQQGNSATANASSQEEITMKPAKTGFWSGLFKKKAY